MEALVILRCKTAEHGYAVGQELHGIICNNLASGGGTYGAYIAPAATSTVVEVTLAGGIGVISQVTFNDVAITAANWRLVIRCR
jgi:hypothetical protein